MLVGADLFYFVKLLQAVLKVDKAVVLNVFILCRRMMNHLAYFVIIVLFNETGVPFYSQMRLFEEIFDELFTRRHYAAGAHVHPVALRTAVASAVHYLKNERLESVVFPIRLQFLFPVRLLPPTVSSVMIDGVLLQDIRCNSPNFLIDTSSCGLQRHLEYERTCDQLGLVRREESMRALEEPTVVPNSIDLVWKVQVVLKFLVFLKGYLIAVEKITLVKFKPIVRISSGETLRSALLFSDSC